MKRYVILIILLLLLPVSAAAASELNSWAEVEQIFSGAYQNHETGISFELSEALLNEMKEDSRPLCAAAARAGYHQLTWKWWNSGRIEVTAMEPWTCPFRSVGNREELITAVAAMRESGAEEFVLLPDPEFYDSLRNDRRLKKALLLEGGLYSWEYEYYSDSSCSLQYTSCSYWNGAVCEAGSEKEALSALEAAGILGYDACALLLDPVTYNSLTASDAERLQALMPEACAKSRYTSFAEEHILVFQDNGQSMFYPGYVILRAVKSGREDSLPERLKDTLKKARGLISGISGTPKEKTEAIHDLLCRHITYTADDNTEEDDCCIGAILNGKANCDGYSDAFLLLCGLENIPVRLVHGKALKPADPSDDKSHMWNLVHLDGLWRGVDVTWDDQDEDGTIEYRNYNMGKDRMDTNYSYLSDFLPQNLLMQTDLLDRPVPEFRAASVEEMLNALRTAAGTGKKQAAFWLTDQLYEVYQSAENPIWRWLDLSGISGKVSYSDDLRRIVISEISPLGFGEKVAEADTEEKIISLIRSASGAQKLTVYCSETLYRRYKDPDNPIWKWLGLGGISGKVSYSDDSRRIIISEISSLGAEEKVAEADTEEKIISLIHSASEIQKLTVYCSETLYNRYKGQDSLIWKWLDLGGISGKVSHSDDSRRIIISEISALGSGILAAEAETSEDLIRILRKADRSRVTEIRIYCSEDLFSEFIRSQSKIWEWIKSGGISDASVRYGEDRRVIYVINIIW